MVIVNLRTSRYGPVRVPITALVEYGSGADVETVIVNGEVVIKDGRSSRINETDLYNRAEGVANKAWDNWATGIGRGEGPRRLFLRPFRQERDEGFSDWPATQVSSQFLDVRPRTGKVGINFKRRLEGLECFPALTKGELDETEPRERTEMA